MAFLAKTDFFNLAGECLKVKSNNKSASLGGTAIGFDDDGRACVWDSYRISHSISVEYGVIKNGTIQVKIGGVTVVDGKTFMLTGFTYCPSNSAAPSITATGIEVETGAGDADNAITIDVEVSKSHKPIIWADIATKAETPAHTRVWLQSAQYNITCDSWADPITDAANPLDSGIVASGVRNVRTECALSFLGDGTADGDSIDFLGGDYTVGEKCAITAPFGVENPMEDHPIFNGTVTRYYTPDEY